MISHTNFFPSVSPKTITQNGKHIVITSNIYAAPVLALKIHVNTQLC